MRQQHSAFGAKTTNPAQQGDLSYSPVIMADSLEVMEYYYRGKLQELEQALSCLNLMDHARQISSLCKEIISTKALLKKVMLKKKP